MAHPGPTMQYACFKCRKSFKRVQEVANISRFMTAEQQKAALNKTWERNSAMEHKCPDCGNSTFKMGIDFKAPKKSDVKAWAEVEKFILSGKIYYRGIQ
jgi:hypothetical protein